MVIDRLELFPELKRDLEASSSKGLLPYQHIKSLIESGMLTAAEPITDAQIQPASIDLRLGPLAYQVAASFLPSKRSRVLSQVRSLRGKEMDLSQPTRLERGKVYIIPLLEELNLPSHLSARANPKSTIGRLDVFTRLITEYASVLEAVPPGYRGQLYVAVSPRAFDVEVRAGTKLNQLRFINRRARLSAKRLAEVDRREGLVYEEDGSIGRADLEKRSHWISVDLRGDDPGGTVGYRAKKKAPPIDLEKVDYYDSDAFWDRIERRRGNHLIIKPGEFYVLASVQRMAVPPNLAAEMVAYDPAVGEFRVHDAGFFDPGFGYGNPGERGARAVLEVRSHEVPFLLKHRERVGKFIYESLMERPEKIYGADIGSSYQGQGLALSKQFKRPN